jgi:hypothetical protein
VSVHHLTVKAPRWAASRQRCVDCADWRPYTDSCYCGKLWCGSCQENVRYQVSVCASKSFPCMNAGGVECRWHGFACLQDKNPDNRAAAEAKFKDISEAYEVRCSSSSHKRPKAARAAAAEPVLCCWQQRHMPHAPICQPWHVIHCSEVGHRCCKACKGSAVVITR